MVVEIISPITVSYTHLGISIIEWGEKIESILPKPYIKISFEKVDDSTRKLLIEHIE